MMLAYTSPCNANRDEYLGSSVFVMNVDAQDIPSEPSLLVATLGGGDYDPDWSYDGLRLAFTSWRTGRPQIFTIETSTMTSLSTGLRVGRLTVLRSPS